MSPSKYFGQVKRTNKGPGGWKCRCCDIGRHDTKPVMHRLFRRVMKQRTNVEARLGEEA